MSPHDLTPSQRADLNFAFRDTATFTRECLSIRNRIGSNVTMEASPGQLKLFQAIARIRKAGRPVRLAILKTRRSFFTAGACAQMFHDVAFFSGRRGTIIADKYKPAGLEAFDYLVQYEQSYRPLNRHGATIRKPALIKPKNPSSPVSEGADLQMIWDNKSAIDVLTAEGGDVGRGGGRHWLLGDEVAFWRAAGITLTAILLMIPDMPETSVVLQSTANGIGGDFYDLVQIARDPNNASGWEFLFFGWLEHPPYTMPLDEPADEFQGSLDQEERVLHTMHGATLEQLRWRRKTIETECRGSVDQFHQEYPTTPEEAFLASGRPVFSHIDMARHPVIEGTSGELEIIEQGPTRRLVFIPRPHGALTIWRRPELGHRYYGGADPSKGIDVSTTKRGDNPDFSVQGIFDHQTGEQVALLRARLRPIAFAEYMALLGRWFNWVFLCPEANDPGFIDALINTGYPLECIYNRQRDPTDRRTADLQEIGFETTPSTREWLIAAAEDAVRSMTLQIRSSVVISECQTFVIKPNGKKEHQNDRHDDCVIMLGLSEMARRSMPRREPATIAATRPGRYGMVTVGAKKKNRDEDD